MNQQYLCQWSLSVVLIGLAGSSNAGSGETFWLDSNDSSFTAQVSTEALLDGTLIGNWDEEVLPDGTKTMPGVWGGEGNEPIPLDVRQEFSGGGSTNPSGSCVLNIDTGIGLIGIEDLEVDLLGGESRVELPLDSTVYMLFDTFRTYNPASLYVGGIEFPIPVGSGVITTWRMTQDDTIAGGVLVESGTPGSWTFSAEVFVAMSISGELEGQPFEFPPQEILIGIEGTCVDNGSVRTITMSFDELIETSEDIPPVDLPDTPLDLPTILPPGDIAHVILSLDLVGLGSLLALEAQLVTRGDAEQTPGDVNGDGYVNVDDLLVVISQWGPCPGCSGDLNGDGVVGVDDLLVILAHWGQ